MLRRVKSLKRNKLRFSLQEFSIVIGLHCSDKVEIIGEQMEKWKDQLCDQYFEGNMIINFDDLAQGFRKIFEKDEKSAKKEDERGKKENKKGLDDEPKGKGNWQRGDRVKVTLIYFLESMLFSSDTKKECIIGLYEYG